MAQARRQFKEVYAPRTIGAGRASELEGPEAWKVIDPHALAELEQVRAELVLGAAERHSCELLIEFRSGCIGLSVVDVETGWGKSVFEDTRVLLAARARRGGFRPVDLPWTEATAVLAFATGVLQLIRALVDILR